MTEELDNSLPSCSTHAEDKPVRGITPDVPNGIVEHAKMVHAWAEGHPQWKRQHVQDKPKVRNHCGGCAAFKTHFCTWNTVDGPGVKEDDDACGAFYPRPPLRTERQFEKVASEL